MEKQELTQMAIELMDAVKSRGLSSFLLETEDLKIKIQAGMSAPVVAAVPAAPMPPVSAPAAEQKPAPASEPQAEPLSGTKVEAPLVGIFYAAPAPDAPPFVEVGQQVSKGDTLCIIEAMKTMNEITAPCDGVISRILVQPGDMVEYKQALIVIE